MTAVSVVLFDLDDTLFAHRHAVERGIVEHMRQKAYETGDAAGAARFWNALEELHYHSYLAGELSFEGQRRARARDFSARHGITLDDAAAGVWFDEYFEHYRQAWALHDDAIPALDAVAAAIPDVRFGIITNGEPDYQAAKIARVALGDRLDHVVASGAFGVAKPAPAIFLHACSLFDVPAASVAYVGDRLQTDAVGAARAGLHGVWLNRTGEIAPDPGLLGELRIRSIETLLDLPSALA